MVSLYGLGAVVGVLSILCWKVPKLKFLFSVLFFGYISPAAAFSLYPLLRIVHPINSPNGMTRFWSAFNNWYFGITYKKVGDGQLYVQKPVFYVMPHRSWADFFAHRTVTQYQASHLSRLLVTVVFPLFLAIATGDKSLFLFKRDEARKETFYPWLKKKLDESPSKGMILYPEGTRNTKPTPLPLKRGAVYMAHAYNIPIQIVMTAGNDDTISEKKMHVCLKNTILYEYGPVIKPEDFPNRDEFFEEVERIFIDRFSAMYHSAEYQGSLANKHNKTAEPKQQQQPQLDSQKKKSSL